MALSNVYTIAGMQTGSTVLRDVRSKTINPQLQQILLGGSGTGFNTFVSIGKINPVIDFATGDIKRMLAALTNQIALAISSDFFIWFQKLAAGSTRASGTNHVKGTIVSGMVIPQTLTLNDGAAAELSCQILLVSADGTTSPLTLTASQALVAAAGAGAGWTLGAVTLNGPALEGVKSVTINFGISPVTLGGSGMVYPTFAGAMSINPTIAITANSIDEFLSWGFTGAAQGATDSTILIQDMAAGGVRGASPITCSIDDGLITTTSVSISDGGAAEQALLIQPVYDGTNLPLAWSGLS